MARLVTASLHDNDLDQQFDDTDADLAVAESQDERLGFAVLELSDTLATLRGGQQEEAERVLTGGTAAAAI